MSLEPGTRLGPYAIEAAIGAGGRGEVYAATDTRLDRRVAIKVLPAEPASTVPAVASEIPRASRGVDEFIAYLSRRAAEVYSGRVHETQFIRRVGEDCANIRLGDVGRPVTFLRQLGQVPPLPFQATGFKPGLVDDDLPARHYTAFLVVGFWLPAPLALVILYLWELAGFVRYGVWSRRDLASGRIGIRHGRFVRRDGPGILPGLVAGELACRSSARCACD